jgi:putative tryptophan/tyrosine transport system substrate-binding protein
MNAPLLLQCTASTCYTESVILGVGVSPMRRREFISLLGGAAVWPLAARAQQPKVVRLGYLEPGTPTDPVAANLRRQFLLGLRDLGYVEGRHFKMEDRSAGGRLDRLPALASELARLPVDIFVVGGDAPIRAAMQASDKIPVVMTLGGDPVGSGFVTSLARPGGNVTGMSALAPDLAGKRLELLKEVVPRAARVAVLWNSSNPSKVAEWKDTQDAAPTVGLTLRSLEASSPEELDGALAAIQHDLPDALITFADGFTLAFRQRIGSFALANRLPMISELREFAEVGGLATYGTNRADLWRRSASYVDKIMRGANAGDLPVEQPTSGDSSHICAERQSV